MYRNVYSWSTQCRRNFLVFRVSFFARWRARSNVREIKTPRQVAAARFPSTFLDARRFRFYGYFSNPLIFFSPSPTPRINSREKTLCLCLLLPLPHDKSNASVFIKIVIYMYIYLYIYIYLYLCFIMLNYVNRSRLNPLYSQMLSFFSKQGDVVWRCSCHVQDARNQLWISTCWMFWTEHGTSSASAASIAEPRCRTSVSQGKRSYFAERISSGK